MIQNDRFPTLTHALIHLIEEFGMDREQANQWAMKHTFKVGTDRATGCVDPPKG